MGIDITNQSLHLLHEIIEEETLPKLSVKSLLRFRCVSKSWRSLIDSKRFIMKQYQNSTKDPSLAHHRAFLLSPPPKVAYNLLSPPPKVAYNGALIVTSGPSKVAQCSLLSLCDEEPVFHALAESNLPTAIHPSLVSSISIVGCCNGLVCILMRTKAQSQQFIVWNPCTRLFKSIHHSAHDITNYGFYCDESDDYRVFSNEGRNSVCKIYSLRKNSWKEIRACDLSLDPCDRVGILARGRLHWPPRVPSDDMIAFDLKSEAFETVEQPSCPGNNAWLALGLIGECLMVQRRGHDGRVEVWVMKEYGVKDSWEILFFIKDFPRFHSDVGRFCMGIEGEILPIKIGSIMIYVGKKGEFVNGKAFPEADFYVESLVSPLDDKSMSSTSSRTLSRSCSLKSC